MIAFPDKSDSKIFWKYFVVSRIDTRGLCVAVAVFDLKNLSADLMKGCSRLLMNPNWAWAGAGPRQRATRTQDSDQLIRVFCMISFDNGVYLNVFACYGQCI